jgi:tight adherence protein B
MSDPAMIAAAVTLFGGFAVFARSAATAEAAIAGLIPAAPKRRRAPLSRLDDRTRILAIASLGLVAGAVVAGPVGAIAGAVVGPAARFGIRRRRRKRKAEQLEADLADAVTAIAAALRAGLSLPQSIAYAAGEIVEPLAGTLSQVASRSALGERLDDALHRWADEVGGDDARLLVGVLSLHRRTGGDLPHVLDRVAVTLRDRQAAAREVRALTAQARLSGGILGALPVAFFLFLLVTSRDDVRAAFHSSAGLAAVLLGLVLEGAAFVWIRRLLRVT